MKDNQEIRITPTNSPSSKMDDWCKYHSYFPDGYSECDAYMKEVLRTHRQAKCPGCGLYKLLILK